MVSPKRNNVKLLAAVIGGCGVIAAGAVSVADAQEHAGQEFVAKSSSMTVAATSTETTPAAGGGHDDGRAGDAGSGGAARRRTGARRAVADIRTDFTGERCRCAHLGSSYP